MVHRFAAFIALLLVACETCAHDPEAGHASAIRNEGAMVEVSDTKILFDPIYDNNFGDYHEITPDLASSITRGGAPYDNIDAVFITHAHGDHFSAEGLLQMLAAQPDLAVYAPGQAVDQMYASSAWQGRYADRVHAIDIELGETADLMLGHTNIQAFYIPHAGWPENHQTLQHYIYRVSFDGNGRVMHLGDASHDKNLYAPHDNRFSEGRTGIAFVPFWMLLDPAGREMIDAHLNADHVVGIHVPKNVPAGLIESGEDYFSILGETRQIPVTHQH